MRRLFLVGCLLSLILSWPMGALAATDGSVHGEALVRQFWAAIETEDSAQLEQLLAPGFVAIHQSGFRDRAAELELLATLKIGEPRLSDFRVFEEGPVLMVAYWMTPPEGNPRVNRGPRLTGFIQTKDGWKIISHSNPRRLK